MRGAAVKNTRSGELDFFEAQLSKHPLLTVDEEVALVQQWKSTKSKRVFDHLINSNLRLVLRVASGFRATNIRMGDMVQEGVIGLIKGIEHFNPDKGIRLASYCAWWVRAYVQRFVLNNWSCVDLSSQHKRFFFSLRLANHQWNRMNPNSGRDPTPAELADVLNCNEKIIAELQHRMLRDMSLDAPLTEDDGETTFVDNVECEDDIADVALSTRQSVRHAHNAIGQALWHLTDQERRVIRARFFDPDGNSLETIGKEYGVSRERIRQIQLKALRKMSKRLGSQIDINTITALLKSYFPGPVKK